MRYRCGRTVYRQRGCTWRKTPSRLFLPAQGQVQSVLEARGLGRCFYSRSVLAVKRKLPMRRTRNQQNGFTLIESVVVIGMMMIIMGFAIFKSTNMMPNYKADTAQDVVVSSLRQARQLAITERRDVQVWFDQSFTGAAPVQHINYQVVVISGDQPQAVVSVGLPTTTQFVVEG